jgi:hypothetical protein
MGGLETIVNANMWFRATSALGIARLGIAPLVPRSRPMSLAVVIRIVMQAKILHIHYFG